MYKGNANLNKSFCPHKEIKIGKSAMGNLQKLFYDGIYLVRLCCVHGHVPFIKSKLCIVHNYFS